MASDQSEIEELIENARRQPGIADVMLAYGQYEETMSAGQKYIAFLRPKTQISTSSNTSE